MPTTAVRKFAISLDPAEAVDFAEPLHYFQEVFKGLGFDQTGTYGFRYADAECVIKADLVATADGFEMWAYVQAPDEHRWRLKDIADAFGAHIVETTKRYTRD